MLYAVNIGEPDDDLLAPQILSPKSTYRVATNPTDTTFHQRFGSVAVIKRRLFWASGDSLGKSDHLDVPMELHKSDEISLSVNVSPPRYYNHVSGVF